MKTCGIINGRCPELKSKDDCCDGCELMETFLRYKQHSQLIETLEAEANKPVRTYYKGEKLIEGNPEYEEGAKEYFASGKLFQDRLNRR